MNNNPKSKDFRYIYANGFGFQFTGTELILSLGMKEDLADGGDAILEEAGIIMSNSSAKLIALTITKLIESYEAKIGSEIPIEQDKLDRITRAIAAANGPAAP